MYTFGILLSVPTTQYLVSFFCIIKNIICTNWVEIEDSAYWCTEQAIKMVASKCNVVFVGIPLFWGGFGGTCGVVRFPFPKAAVVVG